MRKLVLGEQGVNEYGALFDLTQNELNSKILVYGFSPNQINEKELGCSITDYHLPYADFAFDFALCSHYLFRDLDEQSTDVHLQVIRELARVAKEVRVAPLINHEGNPSEFLGPVLLGLQQDNYGVEVRNVDVEPQQNVNAMLRVWAQQCML